MASCPATGQTSACGPRGCAFMGNAQSSSQTLYGVNGRTPQQMAADEKKTIVEVLFPRAPPRSMTKNMPNADSLNPSEADVLLVALGSPARRVLERADLVGPLTGWKDGYLSTRYGFCPPDSDESPRALAFSPGRVWSDLAARLPGLITRGTIRAAILELPLIDASPATIPDAALWAAVVTLGILASIWRYEGDNDGHEGITRGAAQDFHNTHGEADEEPETKGIPRNIVIPFRTICIRLGRPLPYLSQSDVSIHNIKIRDQTSTFPYLERTENMDLRWPIFGDGGERNFLMAMADTNGLFTPAVDLMTRCQEAVMSRDNDALLVSLVRLKDVVDQLGFAFHKCSVNPHSGENFANPVFWGQGYAKFSSPLSKRVPALSGLFLPVFQVMDAFLTRKNLSSFLGIESIHLRAWMPLNLRAFMCAIETHYPVPAYVQASGDTRLIGVFDALVESYAGERGFMGTHRYKVYGFLEVVAKTGRLSTNGGAGGSDTAGRPWESVHESLMDSMRERLEPYRPKALLDVEPHRQRGTYDECRFMGKIINRESIDDDPLRSTGKITISLGQAGLTWIPGDRLAVMPLNSWSDVDRVVSALGLTDLLDSVVPLSGSGEGVEKWKRYVLHEGEIYKKHAGPIPNLTVRDLLRKGRLAPLTKEMVMMVHSFARVSSATVTVLGSGSWPVNGSLGDILVAAMNDTPDAVWDSAFDLNDLSWLPNLVQPEVPRTYSISSFGFDLLPETLDLTVTRAEHKVSPLLLHVAERETRPGVCSGFLNPSPTDQMASDSQDEVLIGVSRPLNFQLPASMSAPIMYACGGSGIAPMRAMWQNRINGGSYGRNILFLGVQNRSKFLYKEELRPHVNSGKLELHVAFSRDSNGLVYDSVTKDLVEKNMAPRYIDSTILDQGETVANLVTSVKNGGLGGYIYVCGSVALYESVMVGIRKSLYNYRAITKAGADDLLAQAFAERRFCLDVFMTPRVMTDQEPFLSLSELSKHSGHRKGGKTWIGVHGSVYDVTDFLPIHPGGTLIVTASGGLDASVTFDQVAHTSNPEVMSLIGKHFIGYLDPQPQFHITEMTELYSSWVGYLRTSVQSLTTLAFEVDSLLEDSKVWFSGGMLSMNGVRKLYQFQSRLIMQAFPGLFGSKLQELYVKLTFSIANNGDDSLLPDVIGSVAHANTSAAAVAVSREIAALGEFVADPAVGRVFERGILAYAQAVCAINLKFLEQVREEICDGLDAFLAIAEVIKSYPSKEKQALHKVSTVLMSYLERIAERLDGYYTDLAEVKLYAPEKEANPARARWRFLQRRVKDSSFFVLTRTMTPLNLDSQRTMQAIQEDTYQSKRRNKRQSVSFDQVLSRAVESANGHRRKPSRGARARDVIQEGGEGRLVPSKPRKVLPSAPPIPTTSTYDEKVLKRAANRLSSFMNARVKDIHRLSKSNGLSLEHAMSIYAPPAAPPTTRLPSPPGSESNGSYSSEEDESPGRSAAPLASSRRPLPGLPAETSPVRRPAHSRQGSANPHAEARYKNIPMDARSESGSSSVRTMRKVVSRSDMEARTFSRHLSLRGPGSMRTGSPVEVPPVPERSHW